MIVVEARWQDQSGTVHSTRARMGNKSVSGACIRLPKYLAVGTRVRVEAHWEKFTGEVRYCRKDGQDFLAGLRRDKTEAAIPPRSQPPGPRDALSNHRASPATTSQTAKPTSRPPEKIAAFAVAAALTPSTTHTPGTPVVAGQQPKTEGLPIQEKRISQPADPPGSQEWTPMRNKWFGKEQNDDKQQAPVATVNGADTASIRAVPNAEPLGAPLPQAERDREPREPTPHLELPSMEDISRMSGIVGPRKGYSINKVLQMLHSEHLRGLSKEMKRASVLMALEAAGITVEEVLQDAKARQDAIDSYEAEQRQQFEAHLARKAEENSQIQGELEQVKARYSERLRRNLDGIAREKASFANWLTLKQQESQSMAEAVAICLKPPVVDRPDAGLDEATLAEVRSKPV
jgi:hypothetical protein